MKKGAQTVVCWGFVGDEILPSRKLTANAPENRPFAKRKRSYSNHPFLGAFAVFLKEGTHVRGGDEINLTMK